MTDDDSRRRFKRYWLPAGPFSHLNRRFALRLSASGFTGRRRTDQKGGGFGWVNP